MNTKRSVLVFLVSLFVVSLMCFAVANAEEVSYAVPLDYTLYINNKPAPVKKAGLTSDDNYETYVTVKPGKYIDLIMDTPSYGIYIQMFDKIRKADVLIDLNGELVPVKSLAEHLTEWISFPSPTCKIRIINKDSWNMWLAELTVFSDGVKPEHIPVWRDVYHSDLMLVVAHPDDDILWFGGFLPTYAGQRGLDVQVVYAVPTGGVRRLELLDALWHCGVDIYPGMLELNDNTASSVKALYTRWGEARVFSRLVAAIRRYKPEVIVTHGINGEYGHTAHKLVSDAVRRCVSFAAKSGQYNRSYLDYGTWQVKKVYLHEYDKHQITFDWHVPLDAFGGKDAFQVADEAMNMHKSQVARGWKLEDHGEHDNSVFGLYYSYSGSYADTDFPVQ